MESKQETMAGSRPCFDGFLFFRRGFAAVLTRCSQQPGTQLSSRPLSEEESYSSWKKCMIFNVSVCRFGKGCVGGKTYG